MDPARRKIEDAQPRVETDDGAMGCFLNVRGAREATNWTRTRAPEMMQFLPDLSLEQTSGSNARAPMPRPCALASVDRRRLRMQGPDDAASQPR